MRIPTTILATSLALIAVAPAATAAPTDAAPNTQCTSLVHVGDSLSVGISDGGPLPAGEQIKDKYVEVGLPADKVQIHALSGRQVIGGNQPGEEVIKEVLGKSPEEEGRCWTIALGTNDTGSISTTEEAAARVDKIVGLIPGSEQILWVDVITTDQAPAAFTPEKVQKFNEALYAAGDKYPNLNVAKWSEEEVGPELFSDWVHYNKAGYTKYADFIAGSVEELGATAAPDAPTGAQSVKVSGEDATRESVAQVLAAAGVAVEGGSDSAEKGNDTDRPLEGKTVRIKGAGSGGESDKIRTALEGAGATVVTE